MYLNQDFTKLTLKKSNNLINASYKLNLMEHRLIALLIAQIIDADTEFQTFEISIKDFKTLFYDSKGSDYWHFKKSVDSLSKREVTITYLNNNKIETITTKWLSTAEYLNGFGIIKLCLSENLKPFLLQLKDNYTEYKLSNILKFKSLFSFRFYELLKQFQKIKHRIISVKELNKILGIEDTKRLYADFKKRILKTAQKEINSQTDISFDFNEIKRSRFVSQIEFFIKSKSKKISKSVLQETKVNDNSFLREVIIEYFLQLMMTNPKIKNLLNYYLQEKGIDYICNNVKQLYEDYNLDNFVNLLKLYLKNNQANSQ
jgi:plasmid replication initiation protein